MKLAEERLIAADPATVWAAMLNPDVLRQCVPGCESLTGSVAAGFEAIVVQKVGPVKARFLGTMTMSDIVEGRSLRLSGEGKGGVAGFAKGGASVTLEAAEGGTRLTYDVDATVGGKIAQLGSRIIEGFAKMIAGQFFDAFQHAIEVPDATVSVENVEEKEKGWFRRLVG